MHRDPAIHLRADIRNLEKDIARYQSNSNFVPSRKVVLIAKAEASIARLTAQLNEIMESRTLEY